MSFHRCAVDRVGRERAWQVLCTPARWIDCRGGAASTSKRCPCCQAAVTHQYSHPHLLLPDTASVHAAFVVRTCRGCLSTMCQHQPASSRSNPCSSSRWWCLVGDLAHQRKLVHQTPGSLHTTKEEASLQTEAQLSCCNFVDGLRALVHAQPGITGEWALGSVLICCWSCWSCSGTVDIQTACVLLFSGQLAAHPQGGMGWGFGACAC